MRSARAAISLVGSLVIIGSSILPALAATPAGESSILLRETTASGERVDQTLYRESEGMVTTPSGGPHSVSLLMTGGGLWLELRFTAPSGEDLVVGQTYREGEGGRFQIDGDVYCWTSSQAAFRIAELTFDETTGDVTHFSAVFQLDCQSESPDHEYYLASVAYEPTGPAEDLPRFGELTGQIPTAVRFAFHPGHVLWGQTAVGTGTVREKGGDPLRDVRVELMRKDQFGWKRIDSTRTNRDGHYAFRFEALKKDVYRAEVPTAKKVLPSQSLDDLLAVHERVSVALSDARVKVGEPTVLSGAVLPGHDQQRVSAQVRTSDGWSTFLSKRCGRHGKYTLRIAANEPGRYRLRVFSAGQQGLFDGTSKTLTLRVRR